MLLLNLPGLEPTPGVTEPERLRELRDLTRERDTPLLSEFHVLEYLPQAASSLLVFIECECLV